MRWNKLEGSDYEIESYKRTNKPVSVMRSSWKREILSGHWTIKLGRQNGTMNRTSSESWWKSNFLLWRRANARNVSSINLHGVLTHPHQLSVDTIHWMEDCSIGHSVVVWAGKPNYGSFCCGHPFVYQVWLTSAPPTVSTFSYCAWLWYWLIRICCNLSQQLEGNKSGWQLRTSWQTKGTFFWDYWN